MRRTNMTDHTITTPDQHTLLIQNSESGTNRLALSSFLVEASSVHAAI